MGFRGMRQPASEGPPWREPNLTLRADSTSAHARATPGLASGAGPTRCAATVAPARSRAKAHPRREREPTLAIARGGREGKPTLARARVQPLARADPCLASWGRC